MNSEVQAENLGILIDAVDALAPGGIVRAEGFRWEPSQTQRLARRVGATSRVVSLEDPTLPPGGIWLVIARALGTSGTGDPRRQARRGIAEAMRMRRTTLLVVERGAELPAATLASLIATAHEESGLRLLLFVEAGEHLSGPLPDSVRTTLPYTAPAPPVAAPKPAPTPAPTPAPAPRVAAPRVSEPPVPRTPPVRPEAPAAPTRASFRLIGPAAFAIGIAAGWFWWQGSELDDVANETPTSAAADLPQVAAAPRSTAVPTIPTPLTPGAPIAEPSLQATTAAPDEPTTVAVQPRAEAPLPERATGPAVTPTPVRIPAVTLAQEPEIAERSILPAVADLTSTSEPLRGPPAVKAPEAQPAAAGSNLSAPININAYPWARIEIEGRTIGETPIGELRLPRGSHDVRAVFADGSSRVRSVKADDNERFIMFGTPAR